jgi:hypothetical protein
MKVKHWIVIGFAVVGIAVVLHVYMQHGGVSGLKSAVGMG